MAALHSSSVDQAVKEQQDDRSQRRNQNGPDVETRRSGTAQKPYDESPDGGTRHPDEDSDDEATRSGSRHKPLGQQPSYEPDHYPGNDSHILPPRAPPFA